MSNFTETILPIKLFYTNDNTMSLYQEHEDYKLLLVLDYLHIHTNRLGISFFSIEDIIEYYGYKPKTGSGKINEQIYSCIKFLVSKNIIELDIDINKIKMNQMVRCIYHYDTKNFRKINYDSVRAIISIEDKKVDKNKLLFYYCYLCCRIYKRQTGEIWYDGGRPETCYPSYDKITKDIGLSDRIIKKYNDTLVNMNLIRIRNAGLYFHKDDKNRIVKESVNHYALYDVGYEDELKESIKIYKNNHKELTFTNSRKYKDNDKKANGYIARINTLEREGKATEKQINKRDELLESKNIKVESISNIRNSIKSINNKLIELECFIDDINYTIHEDIIDYFEECNKDYTNIYDCKFMLEYIKNYEMEIYKLIENNN